MFTGAGSGSSADFEFGFSELGAGSISSSMGVSTNKENTVTLFPLRFKYDYFIPKACIWSKEQTNDLSLEHPQDFGGGQFFGKEKMADTPLLIAFFQS